MPSTERYAVQTFKRTPTGAFSAGRSIPCKTLQEALAKAEQSCTGKQDSGAAAYLLKGDEYIGETEGPITVGVYGACPPEINDDLPF
ncbi:hypothetical protein [Methylobacterium brachiatum]|uniref:hypothetical protein n=1 Tax=Methylobacterium brachiatum TaxID=269660 RepID=UPI0013CEBDEC|nr:hypothetical protein [Methylobacterium brachiatum]